MYAQLTFESIGNYLYKNSKENIVNFPVKKAKNNTLKSNFTNQGKPKAQAADSVKTLEEIEQIKKYFLDRKKYRDYCLFIVGITTGYRCGDLLSLKFSDFWSGDYSWKRKIDITPPKDKKAKKNANK